MILLDESFDFLGNLLYYGGIPALSLGIFFLLVRALLKLDVFGPLSPRMSFNLLIVIVLCLTTVVVIALIRFDSDNKSSTPTNEVVQIPGTVSTSDGAKLDSVAVYMVFDNAITGERDTARDETDGDGKFLLKIKNGPTPPYEEKVYVSRRGYEATSKRTTIGQRSSVEFQMTPIGNGGGNGNGGGDDPTPRTKFGITGLALQEANHIGALIAATSPQLEYKRTGASLKVRFAHNRGIRKTTAGAYNYYNGHVVVYVGQDPCVELQGVTVRRYDQSGDVDSSIVASALTTAISQALTTADQQNLANSISPCVLP